MRKLFLILGLLLLAHPAFAHRESTGPAPSMGTCGTSPSVSGNDNVGIVTVGSGVVTSCALNFAQTWAGTPSCTVTSGSATISAGITAISTTAMTIGLSATLGDGKIYYQCSRGQ